MSRQRQTERVLATDLSLLASRCLADPAAYQEVFTAQRQQFETLAALVALEPGARHDRFTKLVAFLATVAGAYPNACRAVAEWLVQFLTERAATLHAALRYELVQAVTRFRNRKGETFLTATAAVDLYVALLRFQDKTLRRLVLGQVLAELRRSQRNQRPLHEKIKTRLLQVCQRVLPEADASMAKSLLHLFYRAYGLGLWQSDARLIQLVADTCFHSNTSVAAQACRFLLETDAAGRSSADDSDSAAESTSADDEAPSEKQQAVQSRACKSVASADDGMLRMLNTRFKRTQKKSSRRKQRFQRELRRALRNTAEDGASPGASSFPPMNTRRGNPGSDAPALTLLYDPQRFIERLLHRLGARQEKFEFRMLILQLACRCSGACRQCVPLLYTALQRYLMPSQQHVTRVLAMLVDAVHADVPAELVTPLLRHLAHYFVSDRRTDEVVAIGLNTIRELCARVPDAMDSILLQDLVQYRKSRDRGIMMAARGVLQLYRRVLPALLPRRERGRPVAAANAASSADSRHRTASVVATEDDSDAATELSWTELKDAARSEHRADVSVPGDLEYDSTSDQEYDSMSPDSLASDAISDEASSEQTNGLSLSSSSPVTDRCSVYPMGHTLPPASLETAVGVQSADGRSPADAEARNTALMDPCGTLPHARMPHSPEDDDDDDDDDIPQADGGNIAMTDREALRSCSTKEDRALANAAFMQSAVVRFEEPFCPASPQRLESTFKRRRRSLEERLASVQRGRLDRPRYSGDPHRHHKKVGGLSNAEKAKRKPMAMLRPKIFRQKRNRGRKSRKRS